MFIPPHVRGLVAEHLDVFTGPEQEDLLFVGIKGQLVRRATVYVAWHWASE
jgi:hypothetical protein